MNSQQLSQACRDFINEQMLLPSQQPASFFATRQPYQAWHRTDQPGPELAAQDQSSFPLNPADQSIPAGIELNQSQFPPAEQAPIRMPPQQHQRQQQQQQQQDQQPQQPAFVPGCEGHPTLGKHTVRSLELLGDLQRLGNGFVRVASKRCGRSSAVAQGSEPVDLPEHRNSMQALKFCGLESEQARRLFQRWTTLGPEDEGFGTTVLIYAKTILEARIDAAMMRSPSAEQALRDPAALLVTVGFAPSCSRTAAILMRTMGGWPPKRWVQLQLDTAQDWLDHLEEKMLEGLNVQS